MPCVCAQQKDQMQKKTNRGQAALIADRHSTTLPASWRAWRLLLQRFVCFWTALAALSHIHAFSLNDIELWAGTGTNRAALVIHWSAPEVRNNSVLESPIANHSLAWGYRWNGAAVAEDMVKAIALADARLTPVVSPPSAFGLSLLGFILDVNGNGIAGLRNGTNVLLPSPTNGFISINYGSADVFQSLDAGDLYWG
jgi:hypothetical protein